MNNKQIVNSTELIKHNDTEYSFKGLVDLYLSKVDKIKYKFIFLELNFKNENKILFLIAIKYTEI